MNISRLTRLAALLTALCALAACGGAGEERITTGLPVPTAATPLVPGVAADGTLPNAADEDFYQFTVVSGQLYSLEIFASRRNQNRWDELGNIPRLQLYSPGADLTLMDLYLDHDYTGGSWWWGKHDLDIPLFRAPANGTWYVSVSNDGFSAGSDYLLRLKNVATPATLILDHDNPLNSNLGTPKTISPGDAVYDHYTTGTSNFYQITVASTAPATAGITCFEVTAYRNGRFKGDLDYFNPTLILWDNQAQSAPAVVEDSDFTIDDYYFSDPGFCYHLADGIYWLEVTDVQSLGSGDYFLRSSYIDGNTFQGESEGEATVVNNTYNLAEAIAYDVPVIGNLSGIDTEDWYSFSATPGDLLQLQVFDAHNSSPYDAGSNQDGASGNVYIELRRPPNGIQPLAATGPQAITATQFAITGPGAYTIRTLVDANTLTSFAAADYYIRVTRPPLGADTNYVLKLERLRAASDGAAGNQTVERNPGNNLYTGAEELDLQGYAAGDINPGVDVDFFKFDAAQGSLVTINVYGKGTISNGIISADKLHDLTGFGSQLEPLLKVYSSTDPGTPLAAADYTPPWSGKVTAESITTPRPTLSVSFLAPDAGTATYYFSLQSSTGSATQATYFAEVIIE